MANDTIYFFICKFMFVVLSKTTCSSFKLHIINKHSLGIKPLMLTLLAPSSTSGAQQDINAW